MTARPARIVKSPQPGSPPPHLGDYDATVAAFSWGGLGAELGRGPGAAFNMAWLAVDRWCGAERAAHAALRCIGRSGSVQDVSYAELAARSARFANVLATLGVGPGERVFLLLPRIAELYATALGTLRSGCVLAPL
jgi:acetyl-CoA synthetase